MNETYRGWQWVGGFWESWSNLYFECTSHGTQPKIQRRRSQIAWQRIPQTKTEPWRCPTGPPDLFSSGTCGGCHTRHCFFSVVFSPGFAIMML